MTKGEKVVLGGVTVVGVAAIAAAFFMPKTASAATPPAPPAPAKTIPSPYLVHLPKGAAPLVNAAMIDVVGDLSGKTLIDVLPPSTGDFTQDGLTVNKIAGATMGSKDVQGKWVVLVSAGSFPSGGDEAAAVKAADAKLRTLYDRVIWVPFKEMPAASYNAITQNAGEYVSLLTHDATPQGLRGILYGTSPASV